MSKKEPLTTSRNPDGQKVNVFALRVTWVRFRSFGTFGNLGRNTITGPGIFVIDFSAIKNFRFAEKNLQFRIVLTTKQLGSEAAGDRVQVERVARPKCGRTTRSDSTADSYLPESQRCSSDTAGIASPVYCS
jgi:hypothetical protein